MPAPKQATRRASAPREKSGRHGGGGARAHGGEEARLHEGERHPRVRIAQQIGSVDGGQAARAIAAHHGDELGPQGVTSRQRGYHAEVHAALGHGQDGARQSHRPPRRRFAEGGLDRLDDGGRLEEPLEIGAGEDEHQAAGMAFRLIMRLMAASRTSSPR